MILPRGHYNLRVLPGVVIPEVNGGSPVMRFLSTIATARTEEEHLLLSSLLSLYFPSFFCPSSPFLPQLRLFLYFFNSFLPFVLTSQTVCLYVFIFLGVIGVFPPIVWTPDK